MEPFGLFQKWYQEEKDQTESGLPSACCLSTTGTDGYPNARFVSLKEIRSGGFIITGPLNSRKGRELEETPRAALTFWWPHTERQVRIQGDAAQITPEEADRYFSERSRDAKIVSRVSRQGKPVRDPEILTAEFNRFKKETGGSEISRPGNWGGFNITPVRMEFLTFRENRLHERILYEQNGSEWTTRYLQP